jgi:hypothetical protein
MTPFLLPTQNPVFFKMILVKKLVPLNKQKLIAGYEKKQ